MAMAFSLNACNKSWAVGELFGNIKAPKLYFCDNGLVAALLNITSLKAL